jgi:hypothetical protein
MKELLDQGMAASKDFAIKAGAKAQNLGEQGILMLEIKHLEGQAQKFLGRLGNEAYKAFAERNQDTLEKSTPEIEAILADIAKVRETIDQKETELRSKRA